MEEFPKNRETGVGENTAGAETLAQMPAFEEHMEEINKKESLGEKYYQQAEAERERWVEISRKELEKAENLNPNNFKIIENWKKFIESGEKEGFRLFDAENEEDVAEFNEYKADRIKRAEDQVHEDEQANLDKLAECFKNEEMINKIGEKLKNDEDFTEEELQFLSKGEGPATADIYDSYFWDEYYFMIPSRYYVLEHHISVTPHYRDLLKSDDNSPFGIVAKAQMRELSKQDRVFLHNSEEVQSSLDNMEERRAENPFAGETNINSETGEMRTFSMEDNYPQLEDETDEDYAKRLKRIQLKTKMAERQQ